MTHLMKSASIYDIAPAGVISQFVEKSLNDLYEGRTPKAHHFFETLLRSVDVARINEKNTVHAIRDMLTLRSALKACHIDVPHKLTQDIARLENRLSSL